MKFKFYNAHDVITEVDVRYYGGEVGHLNDELGKHNQPIRYKDAQMIHEKYSNLYIEEASKKLNNNLSVPQGGLLRQYENRYEGASRAMAKVMRELGPTCVIAIDKTNELNLTCTISPHPWK